MEDFDIKNVMDGFNPNEPQSEYKMTNPYLRMSSKELITKLSVHSQELDKLVVEWDFVPTLDPYDPDWDRDTRTKRDVELDVDYILWETQRVVKELCGRFKV